MMVIDALLALPEYQAASRGDQEIVFLAALLHDIAKHGTTVIDPLPVRSAIPATRARARSMRGLHCGMPACRSRCAKRSAG